MAKEKLCNIDRILLEMKAKKKNYADWQKERYPVEASHKNSRKFIVDKGEE